MTTTRWAAAFVVAAFASTVPGWAAPKEVRPTLVNVIAERRSFDPGADESVSWRFRLTKKSKVTAAIYDSSDRLIVLLKDREVLQNGDHRLTWDGRDDSGRVAPPGYYLLVIDTKARRQKTHYDSTERTGGDLVEARGVRYDRDARMVRYTLPTEALVRVLVGFAGDGPVMRTVVDWVARSTGEHTESWDGWDASGALRIGESPDLAIHVWAYRLPENAVVVESPLGEGSLPSGAMGSGDVVRPTVVPLRTRFLEFAANRPVREKSNPRSGEMYNHWHHDHRTCHDPLVSLVAPENVPRRDDGTIVVSSEIPLRLEMSAEEASFVQNERFELIAYVDGVFLSEEEQGYLPFVWTLRPDHVNTGEHVVTLMVRGYEGHFGSASIRVYREPSPAENRSTHSPDRR